MESLRLANIDLKERFLKSPELFALAKLLGSRRSAIGAVVEFWELAAEYWSRDRQLIPDKTFELYDFPEELFDDLVRVAERRPEGIYARGAENQFDWMIRNKEAAVRNGAKGGKASAEKRKLNKINVDSKQAASEAVADSSEAVAKASFPFPIPFPIPKENTLLGDTLENQEVYVPCDVHGEPLPPKRIRQPKASPTQDFFLEAFKPVADVLAGRRISKELQEEWLKNYTPEFLVKKIRDLKVWELTAGAKGKKQNWGKFYNNCFAKDWDKWSSRLPGRNSSKSNEPSYFAKQQLKAQEDAKNGKHEP